MAFVYIVQCADGTYYTGSAVDLEKRIRDHNAGKGAKYTRGRLPVTLVYSEEHPTFSEACAREYRIKKLSRMEKMRMIGE